MARTGSCHCGRIAFEVDGTFDKVIECNCSHCSRKGYLLWFAPRAQLTVTAGEDALATYTFNKHVIRHQFCPTCGCAPFGFGTDPSGKAPPRSTSAASRASTSPLSSAFRSTAAASEP